MVLRSCMAYSTNLYSRVKRPAVRNTYPVSRARAAWCAPRSEAQAVGSERGLVPPENSPLGIEQGTNELRR